MKRSIFQMSASLWFFTILIVVPRASGDAPRPIPTGVSTSADGTEPKPAEGKPVEEKKKTAPLDLKAIGTGAVVDLSGVPAGALFETKVLGNARLTWLERSQIDKVIGELRVQALFSAEGSKERSNLGKILKADLLVMLRTQENPEDKNTKHLEIVIFESQRGLRLAVQGVPLAGKTEEEVKSLELALEGALAKLTEKITDVCAVPPFLSQDLDYRFDHLKAAFARVLEQQLLKRKGVLVVELSEARALAKEAVLSGADAKLERQLPLYFLGEYRNEGTETDRRLNFELQLRRGDSTLGTKQKGRIPPADAPKQLLAMAEELVEKVLAADKEATFDPRAEVEQLMSRAWAFERLGNWAESLALLEAALLLDPTYPGLRLRACNVWGLDAGRYRQRHYKNLEATFQFLKHYRRSLELREICLQPIAKRNPPTAPNIGPYAEPAPTGAMDFGGARQLHTQGHPKELEEFRLQVLKEEREILLRLCRARAHAGLGDEFRFLHLALGGLPLEEKYAVIRAMILELKDLPLSKERTIYFAKGGSGLQAPPDAAFPAFIEELIGNSHPQIKAAGQTLQKTLAANLAKIEKSEKAKNIPTGKVTFTPLEVKVPRIWSFLPLGSDADVLFTDQSIVLLKKKGIQKALWQNDENNAAPSRYCYDGQYIWFSMHRARKVPRLLVLDPISGKTWEFNADDGLPLIDPASFPDQFIEQIISFAPLSPGKVCLAGSFGRTWLAIATLDTAKGKSVKVFHEAREAVEAKVNQWERTTIAFSPAFMFVLNSKDKDRRVLIGRECRREGEIEWHPLIVDPDAMSVSVMQELVGFQELTQGHHRDGSVYYVGHGEPGYGPDLVKIAYPGKRTSLMTRVTGGRLMMVGDDLHLAADRNEWWYGSLDGKRLQFASYRPRGDILFMGQTNNFGTLLIVREPGDITLTSKIYQVVPPTK